MKAELVSLEKKVVGEVALDDSIFGLEERVDIIKRVIDWQRAKARSGSHSVKTVGEVSGTTKKPFKQKGTGNARAGTLRAIHMRGGGAKHGPQVRSHAFALPKKVRRLGLCHALSAKQAEGKLVLLANIDIKKPKTSEIAKSLKNFGEGKFFIVDGEKASESFVKAVSNLHNIVAVPQIGANVYDIIKADYLVITQDGLTALEKRLKDA